MEREGGLEDGWIEREGGGGDAIVNILGAGAWGIGKKRRQK